MKKQSSLQSKETKTAVVSTAELDNLTAQIAETMTHVSQAERQGHFSTYWHEKLERLNGRLAEINASKEQTEA